MTLPMYFPHTLTKAKTQRFGIKIQQWDTWIFQLYMIGQDEDLARRLAFKDNRGKPVYLVQLSGCPPIRYAADLVIRITENGLLMKWKIQKIGDMKE